MFGNMNTATNSSYSQQHFSYYFFISEFKNNLGKNYLLEFVKHPQKFNDSKDVQFHTEYITRPG